MGVLFRRGILVLAIGVAGLPARADEIRLKDGKKLYGVIVAYEENMFKVKTDFGYVLVEKDKIASIIPAAPAASPEAQPPAKSGPEASKTTPNAQLKTEPAVPSGSETAPAATTASAKAVIPATPGKRDKSGKISRAAVRPEVPEVPASPTKPEAAASATKGNPPAANAALPTTTAPLAPPKEPEVPAIREDVQGNVYTNHTHGFRMYKAPSWRVMDDARNALPNAIVAMGTSDESALLVVGREKTKDSLDLAAGTIEKRLYEVYENYRLVSQRKTTVGGSPAVEFRYRGKADEHEWSGTLVVVGRSGDIFTVLGMTYADSDLIQIQENVITKAIGSLSFEVH
jgi:hypothetical protein